MHYNLAQLLMEPIGSTRDYDVDESFTGPQDGIGRAQGWVRVIRTHQGVIVRAELETQVKLTCSRCLRGFEYSSIITIEEESSPTIDPVTGNTTEPPEENEGEIELDDQHVLDMSEVIRQYVITGVPIKPLCREECPGLCPECGINFNEEKCKCNTVPMDPRWGSLAELLNERRG
ncbi:MAG: hypothetical protein BZY87_03315 [SAR202 cluster bacterium Io17-Chloro-G6]|nr:MAG: hypothetical protein BZY87_03315 [SAR202 cluster bacterium Io17-Chloro-G6]